MTVVRDKPHRPVTRPRSPVPSSAWDRPTARGAIFPRGHPREVKRQLFSVGRGPCRSPHSVPGPRLRWIAAEACRRDARGTRGGEGAQPGADRSGRPPGPARYRSPPSLPARRVSRPDWVFVPPRSIHRRRASAPPPVFFDSSRSDIPGLGVAHRTSRSIISFCSCTRVDALGRFESDPTLPPPHRPPGVVDRIPHLGVAPRLDAARNPWKLGRPASMAARALIHGQSPGHLPIQRAGGSRPRPPDRAVPPSASGTLRRERDRPSSSGMSHRSGAAGSGRRAGESAPRPGSSSSPLVAWVGGGQWGEAEGRKQRKFREEKVRSPETDNCPQEQAGESTTLMIPRDNRRARLLPSSALDVLGNDLIILCTSFLSADGLAQLGRTSARFGIPQAGQQRSLVNEAAHQQFRQSATDEERSRLPKYDDESDIGLHRALRQLRQPLCFDQLAGRGFRPQEHPSRVTYSGSGWWSTTAVSGHVMRGGRHFVEFSIAEHEGIPYISLGVIRP
ncbi:hypothetical protein THAOC_14218, partial [Thalassiosira oceanica]